MSFTLTEDDLKQERQKLRRDAAVFVVLGILTLFWLTLQTARLLSFGLVDWAGVALWLVTNYDELVLWIARNTLSLLLAVEPFLGRWVLSVASFLEEFPNWVYELFQTYLIVGSSARIAVMAIPLRQSYIAIKEKNAVSGVDKWKELRREQRAWAKSDARWTALTWPLRCISDIFLGQYKNTAVPMLVVFAIVLALLFTAFVLTDSSWSEATADVQYPEDR